MSNVCFIFCKFRSNRNPDIPMIRRPDVMSMLAKITSNDPSTVVFKAKDHLRSPVSPTVFSEIVSAFSKNTVCQALYIQNMGSAIRDEQIAELMDLLCKKNNLWAINIGENYEVTKKGWVAMCDLLPETNVTHLYVSEHIIHLDLKNKMRMHIRANRKKHSMHSSLKNIRVIEQVTHMWWNPINTIRHQLEDKGTASKAKNSESDKKINVKSPAASKKVIATPSSESAKKKVVSASVSNLKTPPAAKKKDKETPRVVTLTKKEAAEAKKAEEWHARQEFLRSNPSSTVYWAKNKGGKGAENPWKFHCVCGEQCSSEEPERVHPVGAMYECTSCGIWSHTNCVLGNVSQEYLEEEEEVLCAKCRALNRRRVLRELKEMNLDWIDGEVTQNRCEKDSLGTGCDDSTGLNAEENSTDSAPLRKKKKISPQNDQDMDADEEVTAALQDSVDLPEIARGDSPTGVTPRVQPSPISPLLSVDMLPNSSTVPTSIAASSSRSTSTMLPSPPPVASLAASNKSTASASAITQSGNTAQELPKTTTPAILSPQSERFIPVKVEGKTPHPTQHSPTKSLSQLHPSSQSQSQSINHIGNSNFTLLTSSPLLSNNAKNNSTNDTGISDNRMINQAPGMSLPTSPLAKPNSQSPVVKTTVQATNLSTAGTGNNSVQPALPRPPPNVSSSTENKNAGAPNGAPPSSGSFNQPMLLQTGNLLPLQDWMSVLTPSSLMNSIGGSGTAAAAAAGVNVHTESSQQTSAPSSGTKAASQQKGYTHQNIAPAVSSNQKLLIDNKIVNLKKESTTALDTASMKILQPHNDIAQTVPIGNSADKSKTLSTAPTISPIATGASKSKFSELAKNNSVGNGAQRPPQPSTMNIANIQPLPIQPHAISHSLGLSWKSNAPNTKQNVSGSATAPSLLALKTPSPPVISPAQNSGDKPDVKKSSSGKGKTGVAIKLSTGSKSAPVVKSAGSPRSTCKSMKGVGSPKGNTKKSNSKKGSQNPTAADITSILINSTRLSYDMKKNGGSKSPQPETKMLPNGQSVLHLPKKTSKPPSSKLKIETDMSKPPLPLGASRGRSMTTGDLEAKGKVKIKSHAKAKAPKISKLDSHSMDDLSSLPGSSTPIKRPRRSSKGFMFVMHARVYVPAEHKVGVITEEKNGGWKYVLFDRDQPEGSTSASSTSLSPTYESDASSSGMSNSSLNATALPGPPKLHTSTSETSVSALLSSMSVISPRVSSKTSKPSNVDTKGKWCRACDMREVGIGDVPLPNKADLLMNRSHLHPHKQAHPLNGSADVGLSSFNTGDSDYGFDMTDGDDIEQDELMLMGRRVACHFPLSSKHLFPPNPTKRKRCESLDTGLRGMDQFFDYAMLMSNNLSCANGPGSGNVEEPDLVEDDWKLDIGSFGGVFLDDDVPDGDCWGNN